MDDAVPKDQPRSVRWPALVGVFAALVGLGVAFWPQAGSNCPILETADPQRGDGDDAYLMLRYVYPYTFVRGLLDRIGAEYDADGNRVFTREALRRYTGADPGLPVLLGMNGDVFDVTEKGWVYYGPGMGYSQFAGRDATRSLALGTLSDDDLARSDDTADFDDEQMKLLTDQHDFYLGKYPRVGRVKGAVTRRSAPLPSPEQLEQMRAQYA